MRASVAICYNEPRPSRYGDAGEERAVLGVLDAVTAVHRALGELGFDVVLSPLVPPRVRAMRRVRSLRTDLVFNLFEGLCGYPETEALLPETLSQRGIPCTGCTGPMLRLALDKPRVKAVLARAGFQTPDFQVLDPQALHLFRLRYPCIVKPRCEDASHGLSPQSVVYDPAALERQVALVSDRYGGDALVEEFVEGREFNATVLGDPGCAVLPVSEIAYSLPPGMPRVLTFAAKWEPDSLYYRGTEAVCPADLGPEERGRIAETARAAFRLLGGRGYARVDMRLDREGRLNVIEINPNPDISPGSGAVRQAEASGMTYTQLIEEIVRLALDGRGDEHHHSTHGPRRQAHCSGTSTRYAGVQAP